MNIKQVRTVLAILICIMLSACSLSVSNLSNNLNKAMTGNDDPYTVRQALPTYIILIDSLIEDDKEDEDLQRVSADMLNAYASLVSIEADYHGHLNDLETEIIKQRQYKLTRKSLERATLAICLYDEIYCTITADSYPVFKEKILQSDEDDIGYIFSLAQAWLSWLRLNSDDWNVTVKVPQIKYLFETVIEKNPQWENGAAYMYLGVLNSLMPANLGGKPEVGRDYFDKAIDVSQGKNLMVYVLYAEYYARLVFDQELHDKLVKSVIEADIEQNQYALINTIAKLRAAKLISDSVDYF